MTVEDYRQSIFATIGYEPTKAQEPIHASEARIKLVAGGERGGKSVVGSKEATLAAPKSRLIWIVGPEFDVARTEFEYCMEDLDKLGLLKDVSFPKQGPCSLLLHGGCEIVTKSAKEPEKLGRQAPDFVLGCESAQTEYEAYLRLRGRIAEKRAPLVMTGTFEGSLGWYPEMFTRWQGANDEEARSFSLPTWENDIIYPGGREDPEIKRLEAQTPHDMFQERYGGIPCKPSGLIISEFRNAVHVGEYEFDPGKPVEIAVDPGYAGAYAVEAIQVSGEDIIIIDEIYLQGYVTEQIIDICKQKRWWGNVQDGAIDVAGKQHQAMAAPVEVWQKLTGLYLKSKRVELEQGIDLLRTLFLVNPITGKPKLRVNHPCKGIISECGGCKSPVPNGGPWLRDVNTGKIKDSNDHACKSVIYWAVNRFGYTPRARKSTFGRLLQRDGRGLLSPVRR